MTDEAHVAGKGPRPLPRLMTRVAAIGFVAGLALVIALVAWQGAGVIADALAEAGWQLLWLAPWFLAWLLPTTAGWRLLMQGAARPPLPAMLVAAWIGYAINWLLPVAQLGGDVARTLWLTRRYPAKAEIGGSVVVDKTLQAVTQVPVAITGAVVFVALTGSGEFVPVAAVFSVVLLVLLLAFVRLQRRGLFGPLMTRMARLLPRGGDERQAGAERIDAAVRAMYAAPGRLAASLALRLLSRLTMAGEVWLILWFMGHPVGLAEAVVLEFLGQTMRAAAFFVPGAYGIQEGGYVLLGTAIGLPPPVALAVSLAKRGRELLVGLPALLVWQLGDGRAALRAVTGGRAEPGAGGQDSRP